MRYYGNEYKVEIFKDNEEGGYLAYIPQLDCWGDGETADAAYQEVITVANDIIAIAAEDGVAIPKPKNTIVKEEDCSGKLSLRLPKFVHAELTRRAEKEECSINQLLNSFISMGLGMKYGQEKFTINIQCKKEDIQEAIMEENKDKWIQDIFEKINTNNIRQ